MRKTLTALSIVLVLVGAAAGCGDDDDDDGGAVASGGDTETTETTETTESTETTETTEAPAENSGGGDVEGRAVDLVAVNFAFDPAHIDAEAGETLAVTFTNEDSTDHTFTSSDPEVGETLEGGGETTFSVTVPDSGVIEYHCAIHPQMTGTIGAASGGSASSAPPAVDEGY